MSWSNTPSPEQVLRPIWRQGVFAILCGLVLAGIVHVVAVLAVPHFADHDAVDVFGARGANGKAELITAQQDGLVDTDPATAIAVCGYDLSEGPVRVSAKTGTLPLSISLHRPGGGVIYALTDRAAIRGLIEFVILTAPQLEERIAQEDDGDSTRELRVVSGAEQGLIVIRALKRRPSDKQEAESLVSGAACGAAE
jgi:uncharacterized membrane protein